MQGWGASVCWVFPASPGRPPVRASGVRVPSRTAVWRFFRRHEITFRKKRCARRNRSARTRRGRGGGGCENRASLTRPVSVHRRDIRQHQDGAAVRPLRPRRAAGGACAAGPLEDHHFRGRAAPAWHASGADHRRRHDRKEFLAYVERCLAPTLRPKDLVMIDNLPAHETPRIVSCDLASVIVRPY